MSNPLHILNVVGARPNFMKVAPLFREYAKFPAMIKPMLVHTGQHYDDTMSQVFLGDLQLPEPDVYLGVGSGTHAEQTARVMTGFENVLLGHRPELVVVVGDVNSTMACAIVAAKACIPCAHVEAGLRSFDRTMPEEINRIVTDALSDFLFTTSLDANDNLEKEGIPRERVFFVGNTMIDSLLAMRPKIVQSPAKEKFALDGSPYGFITLHRPSNVDDKEVLAGICQALDEIQKRANLVWPLHPRTSKMLESHGLLDRVRSMKNVRLAEPLGYVESLSLMSSASFVITDSGGVQEETSVLGIPCLTVRKNTERPVTITDGTNELVGTDPAVITGKVFEVLRGKGKTGKLPPLWDGRASERIVQVILQKLGG